VADNAVIQDTPLYMRAHGKLVLNAAVHNDTLFLRRLNVMDYSLLVCQYRGLHCPTTAH
jgi:surface polysaccharide O-acyltransferase-like enzyme